jgi:hypothetical protein
MLRPTGAGGRLEERLLAEWSAVAGRGAAASGREPGKGRPSGDARSARIARRGPVCEAGPQGSTVPCVDDDAIRSLLTRLARPHPSGGAVIERAAVMAAGADSEALMAWILTHGGKPEAAEETSTRHGLHGSRLHPSGGSQPRVPSRFVLPAGALD